MSASHFKAGPLTSPVGGSGSNMIQGGHGAAAQPAWLIRYELAFLAFLGFFNV